MFNGRGIVVITHGIYLIILQIPFTEPKSKLYIIIHRQQIICCMPYEKTFIIFWINWRPVKQTGLTAKNYYGENHIRNTHTNASAILEVIYICVTLPCRPPIVYFYFVTLHENIS